MLIKIGSKVANMVGPFAAGWIAVYFLLPNTLFARLSVGQLLSSYGANIYIENVFWLAAGMFALSLMLLPLGRKGEGGSRWLVLLLLIYLVGGIASFLAFRYNVTVIENLISLYAALSAGILASRLCGKPCRAAMLICGLGTLQALYTLYYQKYGINQLTSGEIGRAGGTFNHPSDVYTLMIVALPIAVALVLHTAEIASKSLWMLSASLLFAALILTWYRGGFLAIAVAIPWIVHRSFSNWKISALLGAALISLFLFVSFYRTAGPINRVSSQKSLAHRYLYWQDGWQRFQGSWLTGVGTAAAQFSIVPNESAEKQQRALALAEPKNFVLYWLVEMGIGGGLLLLGFAVTLRRILSRRFSERSVSGIALGTAGAWIALIVAGMFDTPFGVADRSCGNFLVGCLLGMTALLDTSSRHQALKRTPTRSQQELHYAEA